jgi:hypothetical protein
MKNIHVLPTDKPTWLHKSILTGILRKSSSCIDNMKQAQGMNIYITSDEEIKEGDWCLSTDKNFVIKLVNLPAFSCDKKIILTTDQDLIKDGIQDIPDEFLEWFVKNSSCESVELIKDVDDKHWRFPFLPYKIIIPKEEPKQGTMSEAIKQVINNQLKQETLEEAAEKHFLNSPDAYGINEECRNSFIEGAKWQQEQDKNKYSEEEVHKIIGSYQAHLTAFNTNFTYNNWFEQFKKK